MEQEETYCHYCCAKKRAVALKRFYTHFLIYIIVIIMLFMIEAMISVWASQVSLDWQIQVIRRILQSSGSRLKPIANAALDLLEGGRVWFYWPLLGWGIGVVAHGFAVFGGGSFFGSEWEKKKIKEIVEKAST